MTNKQLIIIPGIGDRTKWLEFLKPLWKSFGFDVHIFVFGWNGGQSSQQIAQQRLSHYIDLLKDDKAYIIGISAGGTAAVNALALSPKVAKVITVCSPYLKWHGLTNKLLAASIDKTHDNTAQFDNNIKARVLSVHGLFDGIVPVSKSKPSGIATMLLPTIGHGFSIFMAMSFLSLPLIAFLKKQ